MKITQQIQNHWEKHEVPLIDALLFVDGRIVILRSFTITLGSTVSTGVKRVADTTLESVLSNDPHPWFEVEPLCRFEDPKANICYLAGGGDMGNEGFIAAETLSEGDLLWVACFNRSNPFNDIRVVGATVIATNNYDEDWVVALDDPENIMVECS